VAPSVFSCITNLTQAISRCAQKFSRHAKGSGSVTNIAVESTPVYGADDRKIGTVQRVMIDKISGKVAYAVISFGGFLGMGEDYYPMPWASLKYDTNLGGYRVGVTEDQLKGAPKYNRNTEWDWSDRSRDKVISDYYRAPLWYA
jgi:hypothetical protein